MSSEINYREHEIKARRGICSAIRRTQVTKSGRSFDKLSIKIQKRYLDRVTGEGKGSDLFLFASEVHALLTAAQQAYEYRTLSVERITVENSILWYDRARIFLPGHESRAALTRKVAFQNPDVVHFSMTPFLLEPGEDMRLEDITIEDIRIHGEGQKEFIRLRPVVNQYMRKKVPGLIQNVRFCNITLYGKSGDYLVQIQGADAEHKVRNVTFENLSIVDSKLTGKSRRVHIGQYTENISFHAEAQ